MNPTFKVNNIEMTSLWHCFGNYMHKVDKETAVKMLEASKTNVIPVNTHLLSATRDPNDLQIGFAGVKLSDLEGEIELEKYHLMLNINHQKSAQDAFHKTLWAYEITHIPLIKLEVLNDDLATSNNEELIKSVSMLKKEIPELIIMPLLSNDYQVAKRLVDLGCPLLRIMGSPIGSGEGINDENEFRIICSLNVPVVLDGGVDTAKDYHAAKKHGAMGCLINSALFTQGREPVAYLRLFREECFGN